jgi:protein phosphatase
MKLTIPDPSLVLLVGPSGCGKSTFARRHFKPTEVVSSDFFRGLVCDDESHQGASRDAFELLHDVVARRLRWRRLTVIDATNTQADGRKPLLKLAREYHYLTCAVIFDLDEETCQRHNAERPGRNVPPRVITGHMEQLHNTLAALEREGYARVWHLRSPDDVARATVERVPLWVDRREERGPFDVIGDVHGCIDELVSLLMALGYQVGYQTDLEYPRLVAIPPPGRKAVFVGDLGDRGPDTPAVYQLVMGMARAGHALCVMGNHDYKLMRKLRGNDVKLNHGLAETVEQMSRHPASLSDEVRAFLDDLTNHYVLDGGGLVVAHAGLREDMHGRASGKVRSFAMFGDTTGETDDYGLPVRRNWAAEYKGRALVAYGHTPVPEPWWENNTVNLDTGCVFGGRLSALRYPEREVVSVPAAREYAESKRPFLSTPSTELSASADQLA